MWQASIQLAARTAAASADATARSYLFLFNAMHSVTDVKLTSKRKCKLAQEMS
jgi:hypothetical protein